MSLLKAGGAIDHIQYSGDYTDHHTGDCGTRIRTFYFGKKEWDSGHRVFRGDGPQDFQFREKRNEIFPEMDTLWRILPDAWK